jgi:hypothetical protein
MLKVLLVQSPMGRLEQPIFPLGLAFLAGQLEGFEVRAIDLSVSPPEALREQLRILDPDVVALSLRNLDDSAYPDTFSYLLAFDAVVAGLADFRGTLVVGGPAFSICAEEILDRHGRIDYGIRGEGERALPDLLRSLAGGSRPEGRLIEACRPALETVSPPRYDVLDPRCYERGYGVGVQSRRGCSFGCSYCTYGYLGGRTFRTRPVEHVLRDIESLRSMGVAHFQFVDSVFNAPREYFLSLLEGLQSLAPGMIWGAWLDLDVEPADLERMYSAGARKVDFSPDAITRRGMAMLGKHGDASGLWSIVREARRIGLDVGVNFFNGNPGEGFPALLQKALFMIRARIFLGSRHTFVNIGTIRVYAHSRLAEEMIRSGALPAGCDFVEPVFVLPRGPADWAFRLYQAVRRLRHGRR